MGWEYGDYLIDHLIGLQYRISARWVAFVPTALHLPPAKELDERAREEAPWVCSVRQVWLNSSVQIRSCQSCRVGEDWDTERETRKIRPDNQTMDLSCAAGAYTLQAPWFVDRLHMCWVFTLWGCSYDVGGGFACTGLCSELWLNVWRIWSKEICL